MKLSETLCALSGHASIKLDYKCMDVAVGLDEEKNGYVARDQLLYICYKVKGWTCQGSSLIWHLCEVTREQGPIRALVSSTFQRNLCASMCRAQLLGSLLRLACLG